MSFRSALRLTALVLLVTGCGHKQDPLEAGEEYIRYEQLELDAGDVSFAVWGISVLVFGNGDKENLDLVRRIIRSVLLVFHQGGATATVGFVED